MGGLGKEKNKRGVMKQQIIKISSKNEQAHVSSFFFGLLFKSFLIDITVSSYLPVYVYMQCVFGGGSFYDILGGRGKFLTAFLFSQLLQYWQPRL